MPRMDTTRQEIERREEASLAIFALRSRRSSRSRPLDREGRVFDYRTEYQRDRDRILHARAFRRLRQKVEGGTPGPSGHGDRLTHTLEVAQIARTMARALALNEDLAEAIALGHALGTPPFGRDGARALDASCAAAEPPLPGGFARHLQSLRVVDLLEKRYEHPGLNLTHDVREGILKQRPASSGEESGGRLLAATPPASSRGSILDGLDLGDLRPDGPASAEAQAVRAADRIASALGDLDDALRGGALDAEEAEELPIVKELIRRLGGRYPGGGRRRSFMKTNVIHRGLTHLLVTGTIHQSRRALRAWCRAAGVADHEAYLTARDTLPPRAIEMAPRSLRLFEELRGALESRLGTSSAAAAAARRACRTLGGLIEAFRDDPRLLDDYALLRFKELAGGRYLRDLPPSSVETEIARRYHGSGVFLRLVVDHIAGMTDAYALSEHNRLAGSAPPPGGTSSPG